MIIARKIFSRFFGGEGSGARAPLPPFPYAYDRRTTEIVDVQLCIVNTVKQGCGLGLERLGLVSVSASYISLT